MHHYCFKRLYIKNRAGNDEQKFGKSYGVTFTNPDFVQLAKSFGIKGEQANSLVEFENIMKRALQSLDEIVLIDVLLKS
ncbi:thiamine pyrophosphate-dependent enzyme [Priestia megaterium]